MDGKVFTPETKKLIAKAGDDMIKLPFYAEPFDGPALKIVLNFLDEKADKFIPDDIDPLLNQSINMAFEGNYSEASELAGTALNKVIDIPLLEEDTEQVMFVDGVRFIIRLVKNWIEKKKAA
ncbi:hypothetical protein [Sunxiuqinia indica]|uniref:hypothetical protein n=1 Tax=Sunxiuqinia indica TaxID=2692584 RepID=UPI00135B6BE1|nr:hypothetical protein [Sunxiuqinia indica]